MIRRIKADKVIMLKKTPVTILFNTILIVQALMLSSCVWLGPEPRAEYKVAESEPDLPRTPQEPLPREPADTSDISITDGPLKIGIPEAILLAMENNQSLIVERMAPQITRTFEQEELSVFDPVLGAEVSKGRSITERLTRAVSRNEPSTVDSITGLVSISKLFPTGTTLELGASTRYTDSSLYSDTFTANRLGVTVTQALLEGLDVQANLARVNQARLDTLISQYELRGFTELLLAEVESNFWDYALAQKQIEIYTNSLALAQQQMTEIEERIRLGDLAETELAAAQAEVALRRENLINARSILAKERLELLRLLNPSPDFDWDREIVLEYETTLPDIRLDDVEKHVQVALKMRPDLNQAALEIQQGDLEVVRTKNGLLPKLDMFISYGNTGYAETFNRAVSKIGGDNYDVSWGIVFEQPYKNRSDRAAYSRAVLTTQQLTRALENLRQLAQVDVRSAYIEVNSSKEQIAATAATRNFQEEKLRSETEKFRVGKSTALLVGQAQQDLVASQIAEIEAVANYLKALVDLYRLEGSLLHRRGITVPGTAAVNTDIKN